MDKNAQPQNDARGTAEAARKTKLKVDYIKSQFFRVVHADGIFGGITPRRNIHMAIWSERAPIPRQTAYMVAEDDTIGDEIREERICRETDLVREIDVDIVLDLELAKAAIRWLQDKVDVLERLSKNE